MTVQNQAVSSTNGQLYAWVTASPDWAASSFPGPGTALHIAVAMAPATAGGGGGGVTDHGALTGLTDDDHASLYALFRRPIQAYTGASNDFALADTRKFVTASHSSALSMRVRLQSALTWVTADELGGANVGAGTLTITAEAGVTINGTVTVPPNGWFWLKRTASNVWQCFVGGTGGGGGTYTAGTGLDLTGSVFSIAAGGVGATQLATDSVTTAKILNANVTTAKIADGNVTDAKLASTFLKADGTTSPAAAIDWNNQRLDDVRSINFDGEIDDGNSGTADTIDWTTGQLHKSTLTGNVTYTFTAPQPHTYVQLRCVQDATGGRTVTLPVACISLDGIVWQPNPTASSTSFLTLYYDGTNYYYYGRAPDSRVVTESTTARTFGLADVGAYVRTTDGSATNLTVPPNSTTAFPIGSLITGIQAGAGQITFVQGAGVTINKPASRNRKTAETFSAWALKKVGTDEWDLCGDLEFA